MDKCVIYWRTLLFVLTYYLVYIGGYVSSLTLSNGRITLDSTKANATFTISTISVPTSSQRATNKLTTEAITALIFLGVVAFLTVASLIIFILLHKIRRKIKRTHGHHSQGSSHINKKIIRDYTGPHHTKNNCRNCVPDSMSSHAIVKTIDLSKGQTSFVTIEGTTKNNINELCHRCRSCPALLKLNATFNQRQSDNVRISDINVTCHRCKSVPFLNKTDVEVTSDCAVNPCQRCQSFKHLSDVLDAANEISENNNSNDYSIKNASIDNNTVSVESRPNNKSDISAVDNVPMVTKL